MDPQCVFRAGWRFVGPEFGRQPRDGDRPTHVEHQEREDGALTRTGDRDRAFRPNDFERPENPELKTRDDGCTPAANSDAPRNAPERRLQPFARALTGACLGLDGRSLSVVHAAYPLTGVSRPGRATVMSMDPDGMNRILKQQITEWHAIVDGERDARLLEPRRGVQRPSNIAWARRLIAVAGAAVATLRSRWSHRPVG
jgi:hypothetical protein